MNAFEYVDTLWSLCAENEELRDLLNISEDEDYSLKIRQEDVSAEGYDAEGVVLSISVIINQLTGDIILYRQNLTHNVLD